MRIALLCAVILLAVTAFQTIKPRVQAWQQTQRERIECSIVITSDEPDSAIERWCPR